MSQRDVRVPLFDVLEAGQAIQMYVRTKSFADYMNDPLIRDGVERRFTLIGEALMRASRIDSELAITKCSQFIAFRHRLMHGYDKINHEIVWAVIHDDLPLLLTEVRSLLGPSPA